MDFDQSVEGLHRMVAAHHGYLEDLRTESRFGSGRTLSANLSVRSADFDATLSDLKMLGRIEAISEAGEDSAVKLAAAKRHLTAAQTNLSRLQKLQRERKGELRDAEALEKDIAQANETAAEAERQHEGLISTVAQAHIRIALIEDYRAPMETNWAGACLRLRNSLVEGVSSVFSSTSAVLGVLLEFGMPTLFWLALLVVPTRALWRRFRGPAAVAEAR
jgi:multidrug resistance efflux pump